MLLTTWDFSLDKEVGIHAIKIPLESLVNESRTDVLAKVSIHLSLLKTKLTFSCRKCLRPRNVTLIRLWKYTPSSFLQNILKQCLSTFF